jgi:hypothetical protein
MRVRSRWIQSITGPRISARTPSSACQLRKASNEEERTLRRSFKAPGISQSVRSKFRQQAILKRFAAQATADDILKDLPGDVHPATDPKRIDLTAVQPAVERGARNMPAGPSVQNAPRICRRKQRCVRVDLSGAERSRIQTCSIRHFWAESHASTPQME